MTNQANRLPPESSRSRTSRVLPWLMWVAAVGFGALGVAGTRGYISDSLESERARLASAHQPVATVVAKRDLPAGTLLDEQVMSVRSMPAGYLPESVVLADDFDGYLGQRLLVPMSAGQALLRTAVGQSQRNFSGQVRHGIRAMTVQVDEVNSVSGMLSPGDRIDLLFSTRPPSFNNPTQADMTAPLMQDLLVLATGKRTAQTAARYADAPFNAEAFATITVEVTPEQAQKLVLAQRSGRLTALLRNREDRRRVHNGTMDVYKLLGISPPGKHAPRQPGPQIIVGGIGPIQTTQAGPPLAKTAIEAPAASHDE